MFTFFLSMARGALVAGASGRPKTSVAAGLRLAASLCLAAAAPAAKSDVLSMMTTDGCRYIWTLSPPAGVTYYASMKDPRARSFVRSALPGGYLACNRHRTLAAGDIIRFTDGSELVARAGGGVDRTLWVLDPADESRANCVAQAAPVPPLVDKNGDPVVECLLRQAADKDPRVLLVRGPGPTRNDTVVCPFLHPALKDADRPGFDAAGERIPDGEIRNADIGWLNSAIALPPECHVFRNLDHERYGSARAAPLFLNSRWQYNQGMNQFRTYVDDIDDCPWGQMCWSRVEVEVDGGCSYTDWTPGIPDGYEEVSDLNGQPLRQTRTVISGHAELCTDTERTILICRIGRCGDTPERPKVRVTLDKPSVRPDGVETATATWTSDDAVDCGPGGATTGLALAGNETMGPYASDNPPSHTFTVTCVNSEGAEGIGSATLEVSDTPFPTVDVVISPASVPPDGAATATASWTTENAVSCSGGEGSARGALAVGGPLASKVMGPYTAGGTSTFTVTCVNSEGDSASDSETLEITHTPPPTVDLSLSDACIVPNNSDTSTASWAASNAVSCGLGTRTTGLRLSGSSTMGPYRIGGTFPFEVTCVNSAGRKGRGTANLTVHEDCDSCVPGTFPEVPPGWTTTRIDNPPAFNIQQEQGGTCFPPKERTIYKEHPKPVVILEGDEWIHADVRSTATRTTTTVTLTTQHADYCDVNNVRRNQTSGSTIVGPYTEWDDIKKTAAYDVVCTGPGGEDSEYLAVEIIEPPCIPEEFPTPPQYWTATRISDPADTDTQRKTRDACKRFEERTIYRHPTPTVTLSASPSSIYDDETTTITLTKSHATNCAWTPAHGSAGTHGPFAAGTYTASVTCTGPGGTATDSATLTVKKTCAPADRYVHAGAEISASEVRHESEWFKRNRFCEWEGYSSYQCTTINGVESCAWQ